MNKINVQDIAEEERRSPRGKFHKYVKEISVALGREATSLDMAKRHPFDLMFTRIPPGKSYCPYHAESAQWELYLVISGQGAVRDSSGVTPVAAGDAFLFKPGEAHQLSSAGDEDFVYYVIADNPLNDSCHYPDSGKWAVLKEGSERVIIKGAETDYFEGEE